MDMSYKQIALVIVTTPSAALITFFVIYELYSRNIKLFKMGTALILTFITTVIALIVSSTNRRYQEARKEVE
jgi:hypothetical protein